MQLIHQVIVELTNYRQQEIKCYTYVTTTDFSWSHCKQSNRTSTNV